MRTLIVLLVVGLLTACGGDAGEPPMAAETTEYKLAVIARGEYVAPNDPIVASYGNWLDTLAERCAEGRDGIADMIVSAQELLESDRGQSVEIERITRDLVEATFGLSTRVECAPVLAAMVITY